MPHFTTTMNKTPPNMDDITSDFTCLKVSALRKASRISDSVRRVTIGPNSLTHLDAATRLENIENEPDNYNSNNNDAKVQQKPSSQKISTRSGITFSIKKILLENELQRREEVKSAIHQHLQRMAESERDLKEQMIHLRETMAAERERVDKLEAEELARLDAEEEQLAQQTEIRRKHEQQLHAQRILERKERLEREAEELKRKSKERHELIEKMIPLQATFQATYHDISAVSESCKDKNIAGTTLAPHASKLKALSQCMDGLIEQAKADELTEGDVNTAEVLVERIQEILNAFRHEIEQINAAYDAEVARRESELKQSQVPDQMREIQNTPIQHPGSNLPINKDQTRGIVESTGTAAPMTAPQSANENQIHVQQTSDVQPSANPPTQSEIGDERDSSLVSTGLESKTDNLHEFVDKDSLQLYLASQQLLENFKTAYQALVQSDTMKKFRFDCQKAINIPVNAISGVSREHLVDKYEKLHALLSGKPPISANQHPQGIAFCKHILAKKFVNQGETLISSKPEMAFSVAAVAVALWNEHPDFGELLLAYFHKTCPYLVPIFLPQLQGQSIEDYYKLLGYKYSDNGTVEDQDKFLKRMSGLMRLYAAIVVTKQRKHVTKPHPHGIQNAWRWLAAVLNIEPRPDICATLILDMLEVAGNTLWITYPTQFPKLLVLLSTQYYSRMQSVGGIRGGPMVRLEEMLRNCLVKGSIPPPEGRLAPNFW